MTSPEMIKFKIQYREQMKTKKKTVFLTTSENQRHDLWSLNVFGGPDYAFMFNVLIPNANYAMAHGYEIADS